MIEIRVLIKESIQAFIRRLHQLLPCSPCLKHHDKPLIFQGFEALIDSFRQRRNAKKMRAICDESSVMTHHTRGHLYKGEP